jgi:2'-5' RNA ligase
VRLFVAIELSERTRSALGRIQADLASKCDGVRWIPAHQLHITVKFLGDVPDGDVSKVAEGVGRAAAACDPFSMEIGECGCFPPRGPVRIVWAGAAEASSALMQCVEAVEAELQPLGFPRESKPFSPHITIGRVREDRSSGGIRAAVQAYGCGKEQESVSSLTLMSSVLSPKGPTYTPVSKAELGCTGRERQ